MAVELQPEYSKRELLSSLNNITYEWRHNNSGDTLKDRAQNGDLLIDSNTLVIPRTSFIDAGIYSVKIVSFGFLNVNNTTCADRALQVLRNYAIFQDSAEFYAYNSKW